MKLIKMVEPQKLYGKMLQHAIFECPECGKHITKSKELGTRMLTCSHECRHRAQGHKLNSLKHKKRRTMQRKKRKQQATRECLTCGKVGTKKEIMIFRKKYWCSDCASPLTDCGFFDHSRNGLSSLAVII